MKPALLALLALAACASTPPQPQSALQQQCALHVDDDPAVKALLANSGETEWLWQNQDKIEAARKQAIARCAAGRGAGNAPRGGVERPR